MSVDEPGIRDYIAGSMAEHIPTLAELQAKAAITATMNKYTLAGDIINISFDPEALEALASTFTEDGVLETHLGTYRTRKAILEGLRARGDTSGGRVVAPPPSFVYHHLTTSAIELTSDDTATGRTYFIIYSDNGPDSTGVYVDRFRRENGSWLIEYRNSYLNWVSDSSYCPPQIEAYHARRAALVASVG